MSSCSGKWIPSFVFGGKVVPIVSDCGKVPLFNSSVSVRAFSENHDLSYVAAIPYVEMENLDYCAEYNNTMAFSLASFESESLLAASFHCP